MHGVQIWCGGFLIGAFSSLVWKTLPHPLWAFWCALSGFLLIYFKGNRCLSGLLIGIAWLAFSGLLQYHKLYTDSRLTEVISLEGRIDTLIIEEERARFTLSVNRHWLGRIFYPKRIRLNWYNPSWQLKQGQRIRVEGKLKPPFGLANEAGFAYQTWLLSESIIATGYVVSSHNAQLLQDHTSIRQKVLDRILHYDLPHAKWILALAIGYRGLFDQDDWQGLQQTGLAHIVAISGLHLAVVFGFVFYLTSYSLSYVQLTISAYLSAFRLSLLVGLLVALGYGYLAGFSLPTVRAWLALVVVVVIVLSNRHISHLSGFLLCVVGVVLLSPLAIFSVSFWLSVGAVACVLFCLWCWPANFHQASKLQKLGVIVRMQGALSLLLSPLMLSHFGVFPLFSVLLNLIVVPIVTLLFVPLALLGVGMLAINNTVSWLMFYLMDRLIHLLFLIADQVSIPVNLALSLPQIPLIPLSLAMLGIVLLFLPRLPMNRSLYGVFFIPLLLSLLVKNSKSGWEVNVLDVGQGLSVMIQKNNKVVIYDTGASYPSGFNMAQSAILPVLKARGVSSIDHLIISHDDNDHSGGREILTPYSQSIIDTDNGCFQGHRWRWQELDFEVLWPPKTLPLKTTNGHSCVIKVSDQDFSLLLPGDIGIRQEQILVETFAHKLSADLLIVPHHGSATSSSKAFVEAVSPKWAVFSRGYKNQWGFPKDEVVQRFLDEEVMMLDTVEHGQIRFDNYLGKTSIFTQRQDISPYWYKNFPY